jgi:hypothetical protein
MIRLIKQKAKFKSDEQTKPLKRVYDKRLLKMSIDKDVVELANCRQLCPALSVSCPILIICRRDDKRLRWYLSSSMTKPIIFHARLIHMAVHNQDLIHMVD